MTYPSVGAAARALGILHSHIGECCRGSVKSYKGYIWRYVEDIFSPSNENQRKRLAIVPRKWQVNGLEAAMKVGLALIT